MKTNEEQKHTPSQRSAERRKNPMFRKNTPRHTTTEVNDRVPSHVPRVLVPGGEDELPIKEIPRHLPDQGDDENTLDENYVRVGAGDVGEAEAKGDPDDVL